MGYRAPVFHAPGFILLSDFRFWCPPCGDLDLGLQLTSFCKQPLLPTKETRNRPAPFRWMIAESESVDTRVVRTFLPNGV